MGDIKERIDRPFLKEFSGNGEGFCKPFQVFDGDDKDQGLCPEESSILNHK